MSHDDGHFSSDPRMTWCRCTCAICRSSITGHCICLDCKECENKTATPKVEWRPPVYNTATLHTNQQTMICEFCGAFVWNASSHTDWHLQLWTTWLQFYERTDNVGQAVDEGAGPAEKLGKTPFKDI